MEVMRKEQITMNDIARLAKVSRPVVYTVLNKREGKGIHVSASTKERVLNICKEVGYVIPKSARELYSGISDRIAFLCQSLCPQSSMLLESLQQKAFERGIDLLVLITMGKPELEVRYLNQLLDGRVDGLIAISETSGSIGRFIEYSSNPKNLQIIYVDGLHEGLTCVQNDKRATAELALQLFRSEAREKPVFVSPYQSSELEMHFCEQAMLSGYEPNCYIVDDSWSTDEILRQNEVIFASGCDAVFASNDMLGVSLVNHAVKAGVKVPEAVSVLGVGDLQMARYSSPSLSSIKIDYEQIAELSLNLMEQQIKNQAPVHTHHQIKPIITKRASTVLSREI